MQEPGCVLLREEAGFGSADSPLTRNGFRCRIFACAGLNAARSIPARRIGVSDPIADFVKIVDALVQAGQPIELPLVVKLAVDIGKAFSVRPDEVAILATTADDKFLAFVVPE